MKNYILVVLCFCFSAIGFSQVTNCNPIDLRKTMGPVMNQSGIGWNFAYTAGDLISFRLGKKISPIDLSVQFFKKTDSLIRNNRADILRDDVAIAQRLNSLTAAQIKSVLADSAEIGLCLDEKINLNGSSFNKDIFESLQNLNQLGAREIYVGKINADNCKKTKKLENIFPGVDIFELKNIAAQNTVIEMTDASLSQFCQSRIRPTVDLKYGNINNEDVHLQSHVLSSQQFQRMLAVLEKNQPVGLSLIMDDIFELGGGDEIRKNARHTMTLVGRRPNKETSSCEYILRNSWGPECYKDYKVKCEDGNLYVDEKIMRKSVVSADFIEIDLSL